MATISVAAATAGMATAAAAAAGGGATANGKAIMMQQQQHPHQHGGGPSSRRDFSTCSSSYCCCCSAAAGFNGTKGGDDNVDNNVTISGGSTTSSSSSSRKSPPETAQSAAQSAVAASASSSASACHEDCPTPVISNCLPGPTTADTSAACGDRHINSGALLLPPPMDLGTAAEAAAANGERTDRKKSSSSSIQRHHQQQRTTAAATAKTKTATTTTTTTNGVARFSSDSAQPIVVTRRLVSSPDMMMTTSSSLVVRPSDVLREIDSLALPSSGRRRRRRRSSGLLMGMMHPFGGEGGDGDGILLALGDGGAVVPNFLVRGGDFRSSSGISAAGGFVGDLLASLIFTPDALRLILRLLRRGAAAFGVGGGGGGAGTPPLLQYGGEGDDDDATSAAPPKSSAKASGSKRMSAAFFGGGLFGEAAGCGEGGGGDGIVRGIPNFGQTCFMNSTLQALSASESFVTYLESIARQLVDEQRSGIWDWPAGGYDDEDDDDNIGTNGGGEEDETAALCALLLHTIRSINGEVPVERRIDPRELLQMVGKKHPQFRARYGGGAGRRCLSTVGREQQDAEEFLQALVGAVVKEARLDSSTCYSTASAISPPRSGDTMAPRQGATCFVDDDEDEILTVVSGARERQLQRQRQKQEESSKLGNSVGTDTEEFSALNFSQLTFKSDFGNGHAEDGCHISATGSMSSTQDDEKKQDEYLTCSGFIIPAVETIDTADGDEIEALSDTMSTKERKLSAAMRMMFSSTSSITPSPLCGWIGSSLQCRTCRHVRPIQNAPFLDIPVVPTAVTSYLSSAGRRAHAHPGDPPIKHAPTGVGPPCTLEQCLEEFTSVERVQDVECRSCTLRREISVLEEEAEMLRGAVNALRMKARKRGTGDGSTTDDPGMHLRNDLGVIESKLAALRVVCPDEENAIERILFDDESPFGEDGEPAASLQIHRSQAFKCLLLTRLPSVLCIHVQRRFYDPDTNRMVKTAQHVIFPEYLNMLPFCAYGSAVGPQSPWAGTPSSSARTEGSTKTPVNYRLVSAIEHSGGAFYGHYVSYRRDPISGQWLFISDDTVKPVDWRVVRSCQAYMLFYEAL